LAAFSELVGVGLAGVWPMADGKGEDLMFRPSRIVCLTKKTVETLYLLGAGAAVIFCAARKEGKELRDATAMSR
jgi:hypothetical protein